MKIKDIYHVVKKTKKEYYFQKSTMFLYPMLQENKTLPSADVILNTYMIDKDKGEYKLHVVIKKDPKSIKQCNDVFINSKFFEKNTEYKNKIVYTFTLEKFKSDYDNVVKGMYSKITTANKLKIQNYYNHVPQTKSFLAPKTFHENYSYILEVDQNILESTFELCDPPNMLKERLIIKNKTEDVKINDKTHIT